MIKFITQIGILILAVASATTLHAGPYVGAAFVRSDSDFETALDNFEADASSWKAFVGFTLAKYFALEGTYRDFGSFEDSNGINSVDADLEAFDVSARGILPIGKVVGLFAKAGYSNVQQDIDFSAATDFDDDEWQFMYGAGIDIYLGKHFGLRAEWEKFDVDTSLSSLSGGAFVRF